jgi:hypothetical protein
MALVVADRVWETTSTSGTGTLTLSGAVSGYQTFAVIGNGNTTYYTITNGTDWEVGIGTYTSSGTTLSRDTVLSSSLGGTKITVTPGSFVFCDYPASKAVYEDESGNVTGYPISGGTINGTTIGATTPSTVNATTITGQTGVLRGTGQNLIKYSEQFQQTSAWSTFGTFTVTANTEIAPDGTTTADTLAIGSGGGIFQSITGVAGTTYVFSVYLKAASPTNTRLVINTNLSDPALQTVAVTTSWQRFTISKTTASGTSTATAQIDSGAGTGTIYAWGAQVELASTAGTYLATTTTAVYGTPTLSFSGVSTIGLESNGALFVQPAGTGALQAQATTSTTVGGNARGSYAVDWQTNRSAAGQVASATYSVVSGGSTNTASNTVSTVSGGFTNTASAYASGVSSGQSNTSSGQYSVISGGASNTSAGFYNFIGGGFTNAGTALAAVTTQSGTMNATTAVTLSGSNANIKVGQYITGTSIAGDTYVAAISGTALTLSKVASGSSTSTLSFYTPHGVVVGGGNNQATGSYSFIGGGGDAGTASNRNVASGLYGTVVGGRGNTASGIGSFVGGGGVFSDTLANLYPNTASGIASSILGGLSNTASQAYSSVLGGYGNTANGIGSTALGIQATTRSISGNFSYSSCDGSVAFALGVAQTSILTLGRQTTDATATALTSNTAAAGTTNQVILPNNSAYYFKGSCIANVTGAANGAAWSFEGAIMRGANAASTVLIDTPSVNRVAASSGATAWVLAITADTTNGGLTVTVTGVAATTIRWVAKVETTEVTF